MTLWSIKGSVWLETVVKQIMQFCREYFIEIIRDL